MAIFRRTVVNCGKTARQRLSDPMAAVSSPKASAGCPEASLPSIYKEYYPHEEIVRINKLASENCSGGKRRPIYFGTIYVRDGRESAVVHIEGHDWSVRVLGKHINRAFSGDRVAVRLLPRGHWKVQMAPTLDLNSEVSHAVAERVDALNVLATFEEMPDDEQMRSSVLHNLMQLLCDDGFSPSQSGWISFNTVYVTVTAGFTSSHDLKEKLVFAKRKVFKPACVQSIQFFTEKAPDASFGPIATISAFSDDTPVASMSPKGLSTSSSFSEVFSLTGGREGPRPGEKNRIPVGEVVHVYPRSAVMQLCGLVDRGPKGWGDMLVCLSTKASYLQEPKHQASFSSGLPDLAELRSSYEEKDDGFVTARFIEWQAHKLWPSVVLTHALHHLPREQQMFLHLAVSHGFDVPLPLAHNPQDMFPFEQEELEESCTASKAAIDDTECGRVDMRHAIVFTIDADVTVDLDDAMHCRKQDDGNYEVGIHIADVSHFVPEGSRLDVGASHRHATQYLRVPSSFVNVTQPPEPALSAVSISLENLSLDSNTRADIADGNVCRAAADAPQSIMRIPMLPADVSEVCSLNPNVDRYAVSVIFTVNEEGFNVKAPVLQRTIIRSSARLTFESAQRLLDHADTSDIDSLYLPKPEHFDIVRNAVVKLHSMSKMMQRQREVCGGGNDFPHDESQGPKYESNSMVAEWMTRCNSTVAAMTCARPFVEHYDCFTQFVELVQRPHPCPIVIVNEGPKDREARINALRVCMNECKRPDLIPHHDSKSYLDAWLEQVKQKLGPERHIMVKKFLAIGTKEFVCATSFVPDSALLHWSLGLRHYTSFTSPIRKYADLTVHRQVLGMLHHHKSRAALSKSDLAVNDGAVENFTARARLLNAHEANHAAFKKAVEDMFTVLSDRRVPFTILIDSKNSKISVSAEVGSFRVSRDVSRLGLDDRITAFGQPVHTAKKRLASDSNSSAVILYQPSSRKAALVRSGDVVYGLVSFSKTEPSPRARACVILEMVHPEQRLALAQQFTSKHDDFTTLRQYVESVAFADMDEKAHVLGDSKGSVYVFGDLDRKKNFEEFKFVCNLEAHVAFQQARNGISALDNALWTLFVEKKDMESIGTLCIFNSKFPLDPSHPETKAFRERVEVDLRRLFGFSRTLRALIFTGMPASVSDGIVVSIVDEFFRQFPPCNAAMHSITYTKECGKLLVTLLPHSPDELTHTIHSDLQHHLGMVFAWRPKVIRWLYDDNNLLSGICLADIPASCVEHDKEKLCESLLKFSGIKTIKVTNNTKEPDQAFATLSLQKPYQSEKAAYPLDHIVVICREQEMLHSALPVFQRDISLEVIDYTEFYMKTFPDI